MQLSDWMKQKKAGQKKDPPCWGASCMMHEKKRGLQHAVRVCAACCSCAAALGMAVLSVLQMTGTPAQEYPVMSTLQEAISPLAHQSAPLSKNTKTVLYAYPQKGNYKQVTLTRDALVRGKLLIVDSQHPLPQDAPAPNTYTLAAYGKGIVAVRDLGVKAAMQTIDALFELFYDARQNGVEGLVVWRGTLSRAEQRKWQLERLEAYASSMSLQEAAKKAEAEINNPDESEHQLPYTVDIRMFATWNGAVDERPLNMTEQGRYLLYNAWKYGFVQRYPTIRDNEDKAYQFRYIGKAHAAAMRELDMDLDSYLALLHEKQVIQIHQNGIPHYLIICKPIENQFVSMRLPEEVSYEASLDNLGYAVVICTYPQ